MSRRTGLLLVVLVLLVGLLVRFTRDGRPPVPAAPPTQPPTPSTPVARPQAPTPHFRLAGVAASGEHAFAVIADPDGVTALYRSGDSVSGLGRLAQIEPQEVLIDTDNGPLTLRLQPAPRPTMAPTVTRPAPRAVPTRTPFPAGSETESPPSSVPDRPAS
jgi:hypothetical protein